MSHRSVHVLILCLIHVYVFARCQLFVEVQQRMRGGCYHHYEDGLHAKSQNVLAKNKATPKMFWIHPYITFEMLKS